MSEMSPAVVLPGKLDHRDDERLLVIRIPEVSGGESAGHRHVHGCERRDRQRWPDAPPWCSHPPDAAADGRLLREIGDHLAKDIGVHGRISEQPASSVRVGEYADPGVMSPLSSLEVMPAARPARIATRTAEIGIRPSTPKIDRPWYR